MTDKELLEELEARVQRLENALERIIENPAKAEWIAQRALNPSMG